MHVVFLSDSTFNANPMQVMSLKAEILQEYPLEEADVQRNFVDVFMNDADPQLLLQLQATLHTKPDTIDFREFDCFNNLIETHIKKGDVAVCGHSKTELIGHEIEKTEYQLFGQKLESDIASVDTYNRKCRTEFGDCATALCFRFRFWVRAFDIKR